MTSIRNITDVERKLQDELAALKLEVTTLKRNDRNLRRLLCVSVADRPYMDDGEASDQEIDYLRDSVDTIQTKLRARNNKKFSELKGGNICPVKTS